MTVRSCSCYLVQLALNPGEERPLIVPELPRTLVFQEMRGDFPNNDGILVKGVFVDHPHEDSSRFPDVTNLLTGPQSSPLDQNKGLQNFHRGAGLVRPYTLERKAKNSDRLRIVFKNAHKTPGERILEVELFFGPATS